LKLLTVMETAMIAEVSLLDFPSRSQAVQVVLALVI
jgi:hypothetical protein